MSEIVESLAGGERERIGGLRSAGTFFWADLCVAVHPAEEIAAALDIPRHALEPLLTFGQGGLPSQKYHVDGEHVVFPFHCYLTAAPGEPDDGPSNEAIEVNLLVHGDYLLTVHRERVSLPQLLPGYSSEGRSEQYVVYAVLDGMVATAFDALNSTELAIEGLQVLAGETRNARVRAGTLRAITVRLTKMRRRLGAQRGRFDRIAQEIGQVRGLVADNERYFERIYEQLNRLIDGIDAAADSLAQVMDLRLNETIYWLTVVATIFLPLTFMTGFFGMNFEWMVDQVDTRVAFLVLGIGGPLLSSVLIWIAIRWRATPVQPDQDALERLVSSLRRPLKQLPPIK
ncbi:MAG TPA: CorA family divalent cation transporter [Solirubrobacterales bacterium]|jgi:magnesium transporter